MLPEVTHVNTPIGFCLTTFSIRTQPTIIKLNELSQPVAIRDVEAEYAQLSAGELDVLEALDPEFPNRAKDVLRTVNERRTKSGKSPMHEQGVRRHLSKLVKNTNYVERIARGQYRLTSNGDALLNTDTSLLQVDDRPPGTKE